MLVDVHVSPRELSPKALAQAARSAGLHGVVIADTHRTDRLDAYAEALREAGLAAFAGVELLLERGSLVYLPASVDKAFRSYSFAPAGGRFDWRDAMDRLKDLDGVVIAGHPYCRDLESVLADAVYFLGRLDGIETRVGKGRALWDQLADEAVDRRKVARVGSCGGDPKSIGKAMTFFHGERLMQADLVAALREGRCWPVELEAPGQAREREEAAFDGPPPRRDDDGDGERRPRRDRDGDRGPRRDRDGDRGPRRERDGERRPRREHEDERREHEVSAPAPVVSAEPVPAPAAKAEKPAAKVEKPAPAPKTEKPAPAPKTEKPAPAPKSEKPAPAPKAEKPAAKPEKPAPKAEKPAPKAEKPAAKPEKPAAKPAPKAEKPAAKPAPKAEKPAAKPEKPAAKPEKPAAKPAKPKAKG